MRIVRAAARARPGLLAGARLIYDAEALFSARETRRRVLEGDPPSAVEHAALLQEELDLTRGMDAIIAVTPEEAAVFRAGQPAPVHTISYPLAPRRDAPAFAADLISVIDRFEERHETRNLLAHG